DPHDARDDVDPPEDSLENLHHPLLCMRFTRPWRSARDATPRPLPSPRAARAAAQIASLGRTSAPKLGQWNGRRGSGTAAEGVARPRTAGAQPALAHRLRTSRVLQDHRRLLRRDRPPEQTELAALVALVVRPLGELGGRRVVTEL